jgi:hypothetical protein
MRKKFGTFRSPFFFKLTQAYRLESKAAKPKFKRIDGSQLQAVEHAV